MSFPAAKSGLPASGPRDLIGFLRFSLGVGLISFVKRNFGAETAHAR